MPSKRSLCLLAIVAFSALPLLSQTEMTGPEAMTLFDPNDLPSTIAAIEAAKAERGLDLQAQAALGALYVEALEPQKAFDTLSPLAEHEGAPSAVLYNAFRAASLLGQGGDHIPWLRRAAQQEPASPAGRAFGLLLGKRGAYPQALKFLRAWARASPEDNEARIAGAAAALQLERAPDAEELLADVPQDTPQVKLLWGKLLILQGDPYGAIATLKAIPGDLPEQLDSDRRRSMAQAYTLSGQAAEAVGLLEGRIGNDPSLALQLSHAQFKSGDVASAAATLKPFAAAIMQQEESLGGGIAASIALEYGQLLNSLGQQAEALPFLQRASKADPTNKLIWQNLGSSLNSLGRRDEAKEALAKFQELTENEVPAVAREAALRADSGDPTGRNMRDALKLLARGEMTEALDLVRTETQLAPNDLRVRLIEARILLNLERLDEALVAAETAISIDSESPDAFYQRGVVQMSRQEFGAAEEDFQQALNLSDSHTATLNDFAVLLMVQERNEEAKQLLERALALNPEDQLAAGNLASLN